MYGERAREAADAGLFAGRVSKEERDYYTEGVTISELADFGVWGAEDSGV